MLKRARYWLLPAVAGVMVASACTPAGQLEPTVAPTPSPTYTCTALPSTTRCTPEVAASQKALDAQYAAAEASFRSFIAEMNRVAMTGGADSATTAMKKYAAGPYLESVTDSLREEKSNKLRVSSGAKVLDVTPLPGVRREGSPANELTLRSCVDSRQAKVLSSSGEVLGSGRLVTGNVYARKLGSEWKIWDSTATGASRCQS